MRSERRGGLLPSANHFPAETSGRPKAEPTLPAVRFAGVTVENRVRTAGRGKPLPYGFCFSLQKNCGRMISAPTAEKPSRRVQRHPLGWFSFAHIDSLS